MPYEHEYLFLEDNGTLSAMASVHITAAGWCHIGVKFFGFAKYLCLITFASLRVHVGSTQFGDKFFL